jgi:hypothetical protein
MDKMGKVLHKMSLCFIVEGVTQTSPPQQLPNPVLFTKLRRRQACFIFEQTAEIVNRGKTQFIAYLVYAFVRGQQ